MRFKASPLWPEVQRVLLEGSNRSHYFVSVSIRAGDETINPLKVLTLETVRDYENGFGDEILLEVMIGLGSYSKLLYKNKDRLTITVTKTPMVGLSGGINLDLDVEVREYKAVLIDMGGMELEGDIPENMGVDQLDIADILSVKFQLLPKNIEQLLEVTVGGPVRNIVPGELIRYHLTQASRSLSVDEDNSVVGIDHVPFSNQVMRDHIVVPHGMPLSEFPEWVQRHGGGVYNAGLGCYLQDRQWYLYPCYRPSRYDECRESLNIINVPSRELPSVERTYVSNNGSTTIISTGEVSIKDAGEVGQMVGGNGARFVHADTIYGGGVEVADNRLTVARARRSTETITEQRRDGVNRAPVKGGRHSSNPFDEHSKSARRLGSVVAVVWENSNPNLLYPGQPAKLMYLKDGVVTELRGILLHCVHRTRLAGQGITSTTHRTDSALTLFLEKGEL